MLELIVLGQIPGTHFQVTYTQVLYVALSYIVMLALLREVHARRILLLRFVTAKQLKQAIKNQTA